MEPYKLMIVEDDIFYRTVIRNIFEENEIDILNVESGEECLLKLDEYEPDVLILDHELGYGLNGLETLKRIKLKNKNINVIVLTNNEDYDVLKEYTNLGVFKFINKCNDIIELKIYTLLLGVFLLKIKK